MISNLIKNFNRKEDNVKPYLEFKSSTPMTITPNYTNSGVTLQYSLDAKTWTNISAKGVTPSSNVIYFRGSATGTKSLYTGTEGNNAWLFAGATNLEVNGDITMLLQDSLGGKVRDIPLGNYAFASMFLNCTSLTVAPALPATTLANYCYNNMFYGCIGLTTTPELHATTLAYACYSGMFRNCTNLTIAPGLPATTLAHSCYGYMLSGCKKLIIAPELPATTLANNCYSYMLQGCTNLTTAPSLPATTLTPYCYNNMFYSCTKIKISTTKTGSYQTDYRVPTVGTGVTAPDALTNMFTGTGGTFTGTPNINTTYYTENTIV